MNMQVKAFTVSQLTTLIREKLEEEFFEVWVEGEVSDLRIPSSGHIYFILKDKNAQLKCVLFKGNQRFIRFQPEEGMRVLLRGNITVYERRGEYQCIGDYMEPMGSGALQIAFEQMKKNLAREGLFDAEHKRPIPVWPKRIGIVTSPTGAAIQDILTILTRRFMTVEVLINPVRVQGEKAAQEIARAIKELEEQPYIEVIIVTRGGGSLEDLWAFNEEIVARAIYTCRVPVISAVGHEIDYTISDFVADLRAPTPSAAAELVIKNREWLEEQLSHLKDRLIKAATLKIDLNKMHVSHLAGVKIFGDPKIIIREKQEYIDELETRLLRSISYSRKHLTDKIKNIMKLLQMVHPAEKIRSLSAKTSDTQERLVAIFATHIQNKRHSFITLIAYLNALSPLNILQRGYSLCWKFPEEKLIRGDTEIEVGDLVRLKFCQGGACCEVKNKGEYIIKETNDEKEHQQQRHG